MQISISNTVGQSVFLNTNGNYIVNLYNTRVIDDGGVVEASGCVKNVFRGWSISGKYSTRVTGDGGTVESVGCAEKQLQILSIL
jgi:hypothetical protein